MRRSSHSCRQSGGYGNRRILAACAMVAAVGVALLAGCSTGGTGEDPSDRSVASNSGEATPPAANRPQQEQQPVAQPRGSDCPRTGRLARVLGKVSAALSSRGPAIVGEVSVFEEAALEPEPIDLGEMPSEPSPEIDLPEVPAKDAEGIGEPLPPFGGLGGFRVLGPKSPEPPAGKVGEGLGPSGFRGRANLAPGGTRQTERAVLAALQWFAKHQNPDGSWTQDGYRKRCTDQSCAGEGGAKQDVGTTALGLLPFLAAGQTHKSKGPFQAHLQKGMSWLMKKQDMTGDLRGGGSMYSHGLATVALCEAYGMTDDKVVGAAAQKAVDFIQAAQHPKTGGWRYAPGDEGDTCVLGWQLSALKSAQLAGLKVSPETLAGAKRYLESAAFGEHKERFYYQPNGAPTTAMTAVGLLCSQYLGAKRDDPRMTAGVKFLLANLPDADDKRDVYYWYYATQVLHNQSGPVWDTWNRQMRRKLIETQVRDGCAAGSWDPKTPSQDRWGEQGGRIMETSLSVLTLEVYYRYLPLFKLDADEKAKPAEKTDAP